MKAKTLFGMAILSAAMTAVVIPMQANAEKPSAVDKIDVNQYAGKWYDAFVRLPYDGNGAATLRSRDLAE